MPFSWKMMFETAVQMNEDVFKDKNAVYSISEKKCFAGGGGGCAWRCRFLNVLFGWIKVFKRENKMQFVPRKISKEKKNQNMDNALNTLMWIFFTKNK